MIDSNYIFAYSVLFIASVVGGFSLILFGLFLFGYSFSVIEFGFGILGVHAWNSLLCLLFFAQHSVMVRKAFRRRLAAVVPERFHGALYTVASAVVLIFLVLFWQNSGLVFASLQGLFRWVAHGIFFACLAGMIWGMRALGSFDVFGNQQILAHIRALHVQDMPLAIRGPYRWVRHPLYFFTLVLIWCRPDITADRLLFNTLFSAWIVLGTRLEERDLVAAFQDSYEDYRRNVPMLIPWKIHKPYGLNRD